MKRKSHMFGNVYATIGIALPAVLNAGTASATDLAVHIENLMNSEGNVRVALHQRVDGVDFPDDAGAVAGTFSRAIAGSMRFVFADLPPGEYAVAAFHDRNADGQLGTTVLGIPTEPYGFSNDARGLMGPASFTSAAITVSDGDAELSITIQIEAQSPSALFTR